MNAKLITLEVWAERLLGARAPNRDTLRRWARENKIHPAPKKIGRTYFLPENAEYVDDFSGGSDFMRRVRESATA